MTHKDNIIVWCGARYIGVNCVHADETGLYHATCECEIKDIEITTNEEEE